MGQKPPNQLSDASAKTWGVTVRKHCRSEDQHRPRRRSWGYRFQALLLRSLIALGRARCRSLPSQLGRSGLRPLGRGSQSVPPIAHGSSAPPMPSVLSRAPSPSEYWFGSNLRVPAGLADTTRNHVPWNESSLMDRLRSRRADLAASDRQPPWDINAERPKADQKRGNVRIQFHACRRRAWAVVSNVQIGSAYEAPKVMVTPEHVVRMPVRRAIRGAQYDRLTASREC